MKYSAKSEPLHHISKSIFGENFLKIAKFEARAIGFVRSFLKQFLNIQGFSHETELSTVSLTGVFSPGLCTDLQYHDLPMLFLKRRPRNFITIIRNYRKIFRLQLFDNLTISTLFTNNLTFPHSNP